MITRVWRELATDSTGARSSFARPNESDQPMSQQQNAISHFVTMKHSSVSRFWMPRSQSNVPPVSPLMV